MKGVFLVAACVSILAVALICIFLFGSGVPAIAEIGPLKFLFGMEWRPGNGIYGIFPMIIGSIYITAGAHCGGSTHRFSHRHSSWRNSAPVTFYKVLTMTHD